MWFIYLFPGVIQLMKRVNLMFRFQVGGAAGVRNRYMTTNVCVHMCGVLCSC